MSWIANTVPRQICQFLLNRYLGEILLEKVNIEQLSVDLVEGTGSINEVYLDVERINQALTKCDLPFELVEGFVGSIKVKIPYSKVLNDSCNIEIDGLELTCQPRPKYQSVDLVASMIESVIGSMTTSVDLARSFVEENKNNDTDQKLQGIDTLAQLIQIILSRMKVNINKIIIRLEYSEDIDGKATAVEVRIDRIAYVDESIDVKTPSEYPVTEQPQSCSTNNAAPVLSSAENEFVKLFRFSGISFYTDIFNKPAESRSTTMLSDSKFNRNEISTTHPDSLQSDNLFKSTMSSHSVYHSLYMSSPSSSNDHSEFAYSVTSNPRDSAYRNSDYCSQLHEDSPHQSSTSSNPVKFAECVSDSLLLRMKFKNRKLDDENLIGKSGVEIDFALGSLNVFVTPSQMQILARIFHGLLYQESNKSDSPDKPAGGKPMADDDYLKVETELRRKMDENRNPSFASRLNVSDLGGNWSHIDQYYRTTKRLSKTENECNIEIEQDFISIPMSRETETEKDFSLNGIKFGSSRRSCKSQSGASCTIPFTDENLNNNSCRIHWNNVCVILTHDDPMTSNHDSSPSNLIAGWASSFFQIGEKIDSLKVGNLGKLRSLFHSSYKDDHLQFLATPLEFQWTWDNAAGSDIVFIAKKSEILEYLHKTENRKLKQEPNIVEVLRFASSSKATEEESDIIISYSTKHNQGHRLQFDLKKCRIHVDLTMVDRLSNLLFHPGLFSSRRTAHKLSLKDKYLFDVPEASEYKDFVGHLIESFSEKVLQPNSYSLELYCPNLLLELSFPIPLLSPSNFSDNKFAWQLRRVRNERLTFEFQTVTLKSNLNDNFQTCGQMTATFSSGRLSLTDAENPKQRQKILYAEGPQEKPCSIDVIWDNANRSLLLNQVSQGDSGDSNLTSLERSCFKPPTTCEGPFHKKHVAHENEQLIMVGNKAELREFRRECEKQISFRLNIRLQTVRLYLPSKSFYELLYNRLMYDIALWWPLYPAFKVYDSVINDGFGSASNGEINANELFELCKPYHRMDENSADYMDDNFSVAAQHTASSKSCRSHQCAVSLHMASVDAILNIEENETSPKLRFMASNVEFFDVIGHGGDPNLSYIYLTSEHVTMKHSIENDCGRSNINFELDSAGFASGSTWVPIIYPTPANLAVKKDDEDNFAVTVRINYDLKEDSKAILLALGVRNSTVNYELNDGKSTDYWFGQLINFFNVSSYPLEGLQIPRIANDIHAHAWNLAVQYNPEKLPYILRCNVGSADISTNIAQDSPTFRFNVILENLGLFLAELSANTTKNTQFSVNRIISCKLSLNDYVCLMKMGFFRIILTTNEATRTNDDDFEAESCDRTKPLQEIFLQNDILEIKSCVDSLSAFSSVLNELSRNLTAKNQAKMDLSDQIGRIGTIIDPSVREKMLENEERLASLVRSAMEDLQFAPHISSAVSANSSNSSLPKTKNLTSKKHGKEKARRSCIRANKINEAQCDNVAPFVSPVDTAAQSTSHDDTVPDKKRNPDVQFLDIEEPDIVFVDNYLRFSEERSDFMNEQPAGYPGPLLRYRIRDFTISCCIFGGRDLGTFPEQKVYSNLAVVNSTPKLRQKINDAKRCHFTKGGKNRDHTVAIELNLIRVNCLHELYPPDWPQVSRQAITVQDIQIKDHLAVSNINKLLYCYSSAERPRPSYTPMLCLKILQYMPENDEIGESECSIKLSLLPLRIHLDQDTLLFVFDFIKDYSALSAAGQPLKRAGSSTHSLPIMGYPILGKDSPQKLKIDCVRGTASYASFSASFPAQNRSPNEENSYRTIDSEDHSPILPPTSVVKSADEKIKACQKNDDQFFELNDKLLSTSPPSTISSPNSTIFDNQKSKNRRRTTSLSSSTSGAENRRISERQASNGVYFKNITFSPAVDVKLDYCGKHLQVEKQNVMEGILFGLGQLRSAQIKLKEVHNTMGVVGLDRLITFLLNEWSTDIKRNQMYNIVGGLGPVHTFQQISQGIVDLFWMPVDQYRRDGHVVKGIQKGAHSFSVSTASAALELGQHLVGAVQSIAEFAFDVVNPSYPPKPNDILNQLFRPADFKDGVNMAYAAFYRGFHDTAQALTLATQEEVARGNWAIKGVLRQATPTLIRPIVVTSRAATHILGGLRSQLRPDTLQEEQNKWKED